MSPGPSLPPGRVVELPGRGSTWVREIAGPPGAHTLLLLHGWTANADLNWFSSFGSLGEHFRVVALDLRGHGRGVRSRRPFRMRDAVDDAAALLDSSERERRAFAAMGAVSLASRVTPDAARRAMAGWVLDRRQSGPATDWVAEEMHRNDWTAVLAAGAALGRFDSRAWLGEVDVPAAVVLTRFDNVVSPRRQEAMAKAIPRCVIYEVDGDHGVVAMNPQAFVPILVRAVQDVARREEAAGRPAASRS